MILQSIESYTCSILASIPGRLNKALFKRPGIEASSIYDRMMEQYLAISSFNNSHTAHVQETYLTSCILEGVVSNHRV